MGSIVQPGASHTRSVALDRARIPSHAASRYSTRNNPPSRHQPSPGRGRLTPLLPLAAPQKGKGRDVLRSLNRGERPL
jgi:hypothetical protein